MKLIVCIKQVQVLDDEIEFINKDTEVDPDCLEPAINEWDRFATEEALQIREKSVEDGEVVIISVGDKKVDDSIRRCLAMGADRAIRINGLISKDPISVANELAQVIRTENPDLVFCGVQSSDSGAAATGTALAQFLGLPVVTAVTNLQYQPELKTAKVERELEGGLIDVVEVDTPAVITIQTGINSPGQANLRAIKQAEKKALEVVQSNNETNPGYRIKRMFIPVKGKCANLLGDDASEIAQKIKEIVRERLA